MATLRPVSIIQGDSYSVDIMRRTGETFNDTWSGKWVFVTNLGDAVPLVSGVITPLIGALLLPLRIRSEDTETLPVGKCFLVVEIKSTEVTQNYSREVMQQPIVITAQGIPAP